MSGIEVIPYQTGFMGTKDACHKVYWELYGNPNGVPVIMLHGGPGSGRDTYLASYLDLNRYKVLMFDQRGCGLSQCTEDVLLNNTTQDLVDDIEALRCLHTMQACIIQGGSWGSTLAIEYAKQYPQHCRKLILNSIFLGRKKDEDWFLYGVRQIYPDLWNELVEDLNEQEQKDIARAYLSRLNSDDDTIRRRATSCFLYYMTKLLYLDSDHVKRKEDPGIQESDMSAVRLFLHYSMNDYFLGKEGVLAGIEKLQTIPSIMILHGRYDMDTPLEQAFKLKKHLPQAELSILLCGHSDTEVAMKKAIQEVFQSSLSELIDKSSAML